MEYDNCINCLHHDTNQHGVVCAILYPAPKCINGKCDKYEKDTFKEDAKDVRHG